MRVVHDYPPNYDQLKAAFPIKGGVIFAWGDRIYNPSGLHLDKALLAHEEVHSNQQGQDVEGWWEQYIVDPQFRLEAELPAHLAEYIVRKNTGNRHKRRTALKTVANKLASPLYAYGHLITPRQAAKALKDVEGAVLNN